MNFEEVVYSGQDSPVAFAHGFHAIFFLCLFRQRRKNYYSLELKLKMGIYGVDKFVCDVRLLSVLIYNEEINNIILMYVEIS